MTGFVASEEHIDPLFLSGMEGFPIPSLDQDVNDAIDIEDLLSFFDDDYHTPSDSRLSQAGFLTDTPTTSESGNEALNLKSCSEKEDLTHNSISSSEEEKRLARMKRNRENAHLSRMRKKQQLMNLQQSCQSLKHQNSQLNLFIQRLAAENCLLRHHLKDVCSNANFAVPSVPSVLATQQTTAKSLDGTEHSGNSNHQIIIAHNKTGKVSESSKIGDISTKLPPTQEKRGAKRKKIGGAGAAFLTLFSIFLFAGPMGISPNESGGTEAPKLLPGGQLTPIKNLPSQHGRSLMSTEGAAFEDVNLSEYFSKTVDALLKDKDNINLPKHALSSLEDIAPHALSLDKDPNSNGEGSLPASSVFTALAERFFESSGLDAPKMCEKVFTFHSDDISTEYHRRSKKSIEKYILGTHGFKGRSSGLKVGKKKSTDVSTELVAKDKSRNLEDGDDILLPTEISEPQLVSVMLPANSSRPKKSGITAIDHLYVVILDPQNTFSTYACQLPKSLII